MRRLLLSVCFICMFVSSMYGQAKPRIAVMEDFDYGTERAVLEALFGTDVNIGKGIAELLIQKLVNGDAFSVIERKYIDAIIEEQNRSNSDRFDSKSSVLIGQLAGVDAIVVGSITQFGRNDGKFVGSIPCLPGVPKYLCGNGNNKNGGGLKQAKAVVVITARIFNVHTGEIVVSVTGKGESKRLGFGIDIFGGGFARNMGSGNFGETIIGEAVNAAVDSVALQLQADSSKVTARPLKIDGLVAYVDGDELILNVGSKAGVEVGDVLVVGRVTREDRDPNTGVVIHRAEKELGTVKITKVEALSSVGKHSGLPVKGGSPVKVKDRVHN